jgi:hypothetical protein
LRHFANRTLSIAWTLTDGEWEIVEFPCYGCAGWVDTIGTWNGGLIAFGVTNDGGGLWHSPDGYQWTRHGIDGLFGPIERFYSFVEADELRAYGASCVEEDDWQTCEGALWTSTDGVEWQRDDRITGLETHEAWGLEDSTTGYLMAGWTCPEPGVCDGAIMYSTDGLNWQDYAPIDAPGEADRIVEMDGTIIGLGMLYDEYWGEEIRFVAETSDMSTWTYTEIPKELGRFGVDDLAVFNNMIYAVGIDSEDRSRSGQHLQPTTDQPQSELPQPSRSRPCQQYGRRGTTFSAAHMCRYGRAGRRWWICFVGEGCVRRLGSESPRGGAEIPCLMMTRAWETGLRVIGQWLSW